MKRIPVLLFGLLLFGRLSSQEAVHNPGKPLKRDAGRVLRLKPVFEIRDDSGAFFFRYPYRFDIDAKGCLYILDDGQLLKFSPEGKFVGNFFRKGQGPGEIATRFQMVSFVTHGDGLYIYDGTGKIIHLDATGTLVDEVRQSAGNFFELLGLTDKGFLMRSQTDMAWGGGAGFKDIETMASLVSLDGGSATKIVGFSSRVYQGPKFGMDWDNYLQIYNRRDGSLYVSHTCEYKVVRADLIKQAPLIAFTREYPRAPFVITEAEKDFYKRYDPPRKDFANDIEALFVCGDDLWVKTSTATKGKGVLFDVFDPRGRFLDSFYLKEGLNLVLFDGPFLFVTEKDQEENIVIKKYRALNGPGD